MSPSWWPTDGLAGRKHEVDRARFGGGAGRAVAWEVAGGDAGFEGDGRAGGAGGAGEGEAGVGGVGRGRVWAGGLGGGVAGDGHGEFGHFAEHVEMAGAAVGVGFGGA